jgi:hypothetical protein
VIEDAPAGIARCSRRRDGGLGGDDDARRG